MANTIKEIGSGEEFHIRFKKTRIFKRKYGSEEALIDEFNYEDGDEFPSEIIWMPSVGRGLVTWFNFNKVERFEQHGVVDYHRNLLLSEWSYETKPEHDVEIAKATLPESLFNVSVVKQKDKHYVHILISYENHYFRIEYSEPFKNSFKN